jgi:hypothetical protein
MREVLMLQRGFMGAFDIKPDKVAFGTSVANAASIGADLQPRKNLLERLLSVTCDVRPGEGLGALILTINLFTLLGAYYLLKTVRESLILAEGGRGQSVLVCSTGDHFAWSRASIWLDRNSPKP